MLARLPHFRLRRVVAVALAVAALSALTGGSTAPAAAQARLVTALVHTQPERPEPGQDVRVLVDVDGCAPGDVTVELYRMSDDGATQSSVLMTRVAAVHTLMFRTRARLSLPHAIEGWYGARVLCGAFRPPKTAMANTSFAVGAKPTKQVTLGATAVPAGGSVPLSGDGCPGTTVEYDVSAGSGWPGAFEVTGTIAVGADGRWSGSADFGADMPPGVAGVRVRCVASNGYGERVDVYYDQPLGLEVTRATP